MVGHSSLFSQVLLLVNRHQFQIRVKEFGAERRTKGFSGAKEKTALQEQTPELGRRRHRSETEHVQLGELPPNQGSGESGVSPISVRSNC